MRLIFADIYPQLQDLHGIYAISAYLRQQGAETFYIGHTDRVQLIREIMGKTPDLVCYSTMSGEMKDYMSFDRLLKQQWRGKSIIGGAGPTYSPALLQGATVDFYCAGEGEYALAEFIQHGFTATRNIIACGETDRGQYHPLVDLDTLPFPDREIVYREDTLRRDMSSKQFFSGRGCPYHCTYCFNHAFRKKFGECGPAVRKKSVAYLLDEIADVKRRYALGLVVFNEDTFILNRRWLAEFFSVYPGRIGLPYTCNIRANLVDEELIRSLKESGCVGVNWSIESGDDHIRNEVLQRHMSEEQILRTGELLQKYRLPHRIGNVIGIPGESFEQMLQTVRLNSRVKPVLALGSIFAPYPGLNLTDQAVAQGLHTVKEGHWPQNYLRCDFALPAAERRRIEQLTCLFPLLVQYPWAMENPVWRKLLFALPLWLLRPLWVYVYSSRLAKHYKVKGPLHLKLRLAFRAFKNFLRT